MQWLSLSLSESSLSDIVFFSLCFERLDGIGEWLDKSRSSEYSLFSSVSFVSLSLTCLLLSCIFIDLIANSRYFFMKCQN